jgi:hypothetical protein
MLDNYLGEVIEFCHRHLRAMVIFLRAIVYCYIVVEGLDMSYQIAYLEQTPLCYGIGVSLAFLSVRYAPAISKYIAMSWAYTVWFSKKDY